MLRGVFIGRLPTHFQVNPLIKVYIMAETILFSAYNAVVPIFAVFVTNNISGGSVEIAASSYSTYLIFRVLFEIVSGMKIAKISEKAKIVVTMLGITIVSVSYIGFALSTTIWMIFIFFAVMGIGLGIASPAKNSLFSTHLDKHRESTEWAMLDAAVFTGMALSASLGGFIAMRYGFPLLFYVVAGITTLSLIPYGAYLGSSKT
ncbi:MAG: MFS transporter [Candidatus Roizmanbacteria bacterium]|nr:MFS transporter [Candidatus Roizmanbacteria bacterium]